jgi:hypothetical protein
VQDDVLLDPPGLELAQDAEGRGAALELVFARFQVARGPAEGGQKDEACAASDSAPSVQTSGDAQDPVVGGNLDEHSPVLEGLGGSQNFSPQKDDETGAKEHEEGDGGTQPHDFPV